ncbi:HAD family phosphatase [Nocardia sp. XZ_19_385]|uniref:HAD family hydrolase n=1 Tax=Nocardia sp. XZ_19_385 TaxID=2769488 RepID=UPI002814AE10|nr:HAD family phosphatase [Nocardia sp. XZ_19_385]
MTIPQVVLFDLFGVIARDQSEAGKHRLLEAAGRVHPSEFWPTYWAHRPPYDRGEITGSSYWQRVAGTLSTTFDPRQTADLIEADLFSWSEVDDAMVELLEDLTAAGRPIALLSNIPEDLAAHYERQHSWLQLFRIRAFSCRIGHTKPDPAAYLWCTDSLARTPDQILFVDDRQENVAAAEAIGMHGHLFRGSVALREALRQ